MTELTPSIKNITSQATHDQQVVALWLHGRSNHTQRAYQTDAKLFFHFLHNKPLQTITVGDIQAFISSLQSLASSTQARRISCIKSLLSYAHRIGYIPFNVGAVIKSPPIHNRLAERILSEAEVHRMINLETQPRNHTLLTLLYAAGLRISEACTLTWRDLKPRDNAGQVSIFGKGGKTRVILLSHETWNKLVQLRKTNLEHEPVFKSRKGGHSLSPSQGHRIVRAAAKRAGIHRNVSPHWFRHAHASHALDRGAPLHLVQATLGHTSIATTGRYLHAKPTDSSARYLGM